MGVITNQNQRAVFRDMIDANNFNFSENFG